MKKFSSVPFIIGMVLVILLTGSCDRNPAGIPPAGTTGKDFPNSFLIQEIWGGLNDCGKILTWYVPGVGIVKKHQWEISFGMANAYWELMSHVIR